MNSMIPIPRLIVERLTRSVVRTRMLIALICAVLFLTGCAKGPQPRLYMLDRPFSTQLAGLEKGLAVGIDPIELPKYLDRPQIITRNGVVHLQASEGHVWAEPIKDSVSRVLAVTLARKLGSNRIYLLPRRIRTTLDWRITIDVGRFDGALGGDITLATRWSLFRGDEKNTTVTRVSIVEKPVAGNDYEALVFAQTSALASLAEEIASEILDLSRR